MGTVATRGAMAACARVKCADERAQMAEECTGATDSPARPSESGAEGTEDADLLASASRRPLSARRRMTVVGESKACSRAAETWSLLSARALAPGNEDRRARVKAREGRT
eukprot:580673-Pleurochrysis_carterae.AAC.2